MDVSIQDYDDAGTYAPPEDKPKAPPSKPKVTTPFHPSQGGQNQGGGGVSTAGQATGVSRSAPQRDYSSHHAYGLNRGGIVDLL